MWELLVAPICSLTLARILPPLVCKLARRCKLIDRPDARRKLHSQSMPLAAG